MSDGAYLQRIYRLLREGVGGWLWPGDPKRLGRYGEAIACRELERRGYEIVGRGVRTRLGEIDIVALDGPVLVIVEVKTRATMRFGRPVEAVGWNKQKRLLRLGRAYAAKKKWKGRPLRFDVVGVEVGSGWRTRIEVIRGAFEEN